MSHVTSAATEWTHWITENTQLRTHWIIENTQLGTHTESLRTYNWEHILNHWEHTLNHWEHTTENTTESLRTHNWVQSCACNQVGAHASTSICRLLVVTTAAHCFPWFFLSTWVCLKTHGHPWWGAGDLLVDYQFFVFSVFDDECSESHVYHHKILQSVTCPESSWPRRSPWMYETQVPILLLSVG